MSQIEQILKDGIAGGWKRPKDYRNNQNGTDIPIEAIDIEAVLLNPLFWQAVGKTRGWGECISAYNNAYTEDYRAKMHRFIDHLASGLTIEDALAKL